MVFQGCDDGRYPASFTGPYETVVENFRSLLIYTDLYIKIKAADCVVVFKGLHLEIETYTQDVLKITGQIQSVEFLCC